MGSQKSFRQIGTRQLELRAYDTKPMLAFLSPPSRHCPSWRPSSLSLLHHSVRESRCSHVLLSSRAHEDGLKFLSPVLFILYSHISPLDIWENSFHKLPTALPRTFQWKLSPGTQFPFLDSPGREEILPVTGSSHLSSVLIFHLIVTYVGCSGHDCPISCIRKL